LHKTCLPGVYEITGETDTLPLIFDSPHSGRNYPGDFDYSCDFSTLQKAEDRFVDRLFTKVPYNGGILLNALFPRTYIDVNRTLEDIDPELLADEWDGPINPSARAYAGIGLIRRLISPGIPLYNRTLSSEEIRQRIDKYYIPYHKALKNLLDSAYKTHGSFWHINCHSMPSKSKLYKLYSDGKGKFADFVLGDRDGTSCENDFITVLKEYLLDRGFNVSLNEPYRGVELVRLYSNPPAGKNSVQLEINRSLYLDEQSGKPLPDFNKFKKEMDKLSKFCADYVASRFIQMAAD
jgi:N-formylglutamate amidohydrolase